MSCRSRPQWLGVLVRKRVPARQATLRTHVLRWAPRRPHLMAGSTSRVGLGRSSPIIANDAMPTEGALHRYRLHVAQVLREALDTSAGGATVEPSKPLPGSTRAKPISRIGRRGFPRSFERLRRVSR